MRLILALLLLCWHPLAPDHIAMVPHSIAEANRDMEERVITCDVTWYCDQDCHPRWSKMYGLTASGVRADENTAASDTLPFGTVVFVPNVGFRVIRDRGVGGPGIDCWCGSRAEALRRGRVKTEVRVLN